MLKAVLQFDTILKVACYQIFITDIQLTRCYSCLWSCHYCEGFWPRWYSSITWNVYSVHSTTSILCFGQKPLVQFYFFKLTHYLMIIPQCHSKVADPWARNTVRSNVSWAFRSTFIFEFESWKVFLAYEVSIRQMLCENNQSTSSRNGIFWAFFHPTVFHRLVALARVQVDHVLFIFGYVHSCWSLSTSISVSLHSWVKTTSPTPGFDPFCMFTCVSLVRVSDLQVQGKVDEAILDDWLDHTLSLLYLFQCLWERKEVKWTNTTTKIT